MFHESGIQSGTQAQLALGTICPSWHAMSKDRLLALLAFDILEERHTLQVFQEKNFNNQQNSTPGNITQTAKLHARSNTKDDTIKRATQRPGHPTRVGRSTRESTTAEVASLVLLSTTSMYFVNSLALSLVSVNARH